jgi:3-hydroxybutyryl-CoA dehydrogenase
MTDKINTIGIIGEGKMGTNIFYYLTGFDYQLVWICSTDADIDKLQRSFDKKIRRSVDAGIMDISRGGFLRDKTIISADLQSLSTCDLIIEAIPEDIELKKELFREVDRIAGSSCILTSNSSSINPSEMIPSEKRKDKFAGIHFFYPIALKNIVEFILPETISRANRELITGFLQNIRRDYLILKEKDSFILNRIFLDFQNEAFLLTCQEKFSYSQMDALVKEHFFPTGVFEFFDSVGLETMLASIKNYIRDYPHREYYGSLVSKLEELAGQESHGGFLSGDKIPGEVIASDVEEAVQRLRFTYRASFKRFAVQSKLSLNDLNNAVKEYFGIDHGPLDPGT